MAVVAEDLAQVILVDVLGQALYHNLDVEEAGVSKAAQNEDGVLRQLTLVLRRGVSL